MMNIQKETHKKILVPKNEDFLAGVDGFEPPTVGVRVQCLTAWRYPTEQELLYPKNCICQEI